jgi:hypothetical protein
MPSRCHDERTGFNTGQSEFIFYKL